MKKPRIGQRVTALGFINIFVVMKIDESRRVADIQHIGQPNVIEKNMPFENMYPAGEDSSQAAVRIVREATENK